MARMLTVKEDGGAPKFARTYANENFQSVESTLQWAAAGAAAVIVLDELSK